MTETKVLDVVAIVAGILLILLIVFCIGMAILISPLFLLLTIPAGLWVYVLLIDDSAALTKRSIKNLFSKLKH